jgi:hypothetical protein
MPEAFPKLKTIDDYPQHRLLAGSIHQRNGVDSVADPVNFQKISWI